jgi:phospholipase/carboxylesterase
MTLDTLHFQTGEQPVATIVVLHGLGADGNDFVPIARELDLSPIGAVRYVFPHAPVRPVTINGGMPMRAWYDLLGMNLTQREDETGLRASLAEVQALLDAEAARGVPPERTVLMGFSQGCAMTLMTGLRAPQRLAGLVGLSGYLPLAASTAAEVSDANRLTPLFLGHGRRDGIVPLAAGTATRDTLTGLGYDVSWHDYPMEHSVCPEEISDLNRWLLKVLARA